MPADEGADPDRVVWLTRDEALAIHERVIERFGGEAGLRDPGLLESALYRPRTGYYADLPSMAAALFESLLKTHAFADGNKRVAFFATDVFLRVNGWRLVVDPDEAHAFLVEGLTEGALDYERILTWIRESLEPLKSPETLQPSEPEKPRPGAGEPPRAGPPADPDPDRGPVLAGGMDHRDPPGHEPPTLPDPVELHAIAGAQRGAVERPALDQELLARAVPLDDAAAPPPAEPHHGPRRALAVPRSVSHPRRSFARLSSSSSTVARIRPRPSA